MKLHAGMALETPDDGVIVLVEKVPPFSRLHPPGVVAAMAGWMVFSPERVDTVYYFEYEDWLENYCQVFK